MELKYSSILNKPIRDCCYWACEVAKDILGIDILIRKRTPELQNLQTIQANKLIKEDLKDFGWDEITDIPKKGDIILVNLRGFLQPGILVEDKLLAIFGKLKQLDRVKIEKIYRKTRESVSQCAPLEDILKRP